MRIGWRLKHLEHLASARLPAGVDLDRCSRNFTMESVYRDIPMTSERVEIQQAARLRAPGDFGLAVQQARLARGMSQKELAAELGVPQSTISEIENGKSTIYLRRLLSIARVTGIEFRASWSSASGQPAESESPGAPQSSDDAPRD